ncbi:MAG: prepilin-type N-terminal cleavage/methylation domain-containing protein [Minisyncoccia bacterium]
MMYLTNQKGRSVVSKPRFGAGYTLVELIVAVGLFSLIMLLASGAYLMMIALNRQTQSISTGINNLSFAFETMTRSIRTGSEYSCGGLGDCVNGGNSFSFRSESGAAVTYSLSGSSIQQTTGSVQSTLTDPSVTVTNLKFYVFGSSPASSGDRNQAHVTMVVSGTVPTGPGKPPQAFTVETGATMRGSDI